MQMCRCYRLLLPITSLIALHLGRRMQIVNLAHPNDLLSKVLLALINAKLNGA